MKIKLKENTITDLIQLLDCLTDAVRENKVKLKDLGYKKLAFNQECGWSKVRSDIRQKQWELQDAYNDAVEKKKEREFQKYGTEQTYCYELWLRVQKSKSFISEGKTKRFEFEVKAKSYIEADKKATAKANQIVDILNGAQYVYNAYPCDYCGDEEPDTYKYGLDSIELISVDGVEIDDLRSCERQEDW